MKKIIIVVMVLLIVLSGCTSLKWSELPKEEQNNVVITGILVVVWSVVSGYLFVNSAEPFTDSELERR